MSDLKLNAHTIELTHLDKILFPDDGITKGDLIDYYRRIADTMLPYLKDRPISMKRFPHGLSGEGFYHKEVPDYFPDWITHATVDLHDDRGTQEQVVINDAATLVYIANQSCITPHIWLSRKDNLRKPDRMIFDLDPPDDDFEQVRKAALNMRTLLNELGLTSFIMTTGSRGLHVVVPLVRRKDFDEVRPLVKDIAEILSERFPDELTTEIRKVERKGRLFIDYLRNSYSQTAVAPYAVRARNGAPVATPLEWDELDNKDLNAHKFTIKNIFQRLSRKKDPWKNINRHSQSMSKVEKKIKILMDEQG